MLRLAAGLPDALVGLAPDGGRALGLRLDDRPETPRQALAVPGVEQDRVERGAEDVVLALVEGAVADPHGLGAGVAREVVPRGLGQVAPAVDPVHDLQGAVLGRLDVGDELHVLVGFPVQVEPVQRLEREGAVADPRVAVVPVALAAGGLGQRGRQRGDGRAGRHVGEALDRERRALDRVPPAVVRDPRPLQPGAPEADRRGELRLRLLDVLRRGELLGPRERAVGAVAGLEHVPRADAVALGAEREVGLEADRLAGSARVGCVAAAVDHRPLRRRPAVVEGRLADELDLDAALEALDRADEHVIGVVVRRRPCVRGDRVLVLARAHRQRVADDDPAVRRLPGRLEDVRPRHVGARGRVVDPERREAEEARLAGRAGCRTRSASRSSACRASRSLRPPRRAPPCGSSRGRRSRRSAGTGTVPPRSAARGSGFALTAITPSPTGRASGRARPAACSPPRDPTNPARTRARAAARRAAAA